MINNQHLQVEELSKIDGLLDKNEACKILGNIGITKLYQLLNGGHIKGVKIGRSLKIKRSEVLRYISELPEYKSEIQAA